MRKWREWFLNGGLLWLRVLAGAGIALHGYQKLSLEHIKMFTPVVEKMGFPFPVVFAYLNVLAEFAGGILIALGLATRPAAFGVFFNMSVAAFLFHAGTALNVRELALAYWTASGTLLLSGPGSLSLDRLLSGGRKRR